MRNNNSKVRQATENFLTSGDIANLPSSFFSQCIVVLYGGNGSEHDISVQTKDAVVTAMRVMGFSNIKTLSFDQNIIENLTKQKPDIVFVAMHGAYGEDGIAQIIMDFLQIPYTHSGFKTNNTAINKAFLANIVEDILGIKASKREIILKTQLLENYKAPYDCIIKPYDQGSSICTFFLKNGQGISQQDLDLCHKSDINYFIQDQYFQGEDVGVAICNNQCTGIVRMMQSQNKEIFDYELKYSGRMLYSVSKNGFGLSESAVKSIKQISLDIHHIIGAKTVSRSDFKVRGDEFQFLETNTHPGLTDSSLVPKINANIGISYNSLIVKLLMDASYSISCSQE